MNNLSERIAERLRDRAYSSKFPDPLLEAAANEIDRLRNGAVRGCETVQSATNHDVAPAAIAVSDEDRTDKAATSHRDDGTGDTPVTEPMLKEKRDEVSVSEPVGWVVAIPLGGKRFAVDDFFVSHGEAQKACKWRIENTQRGAEVIPLYRLPTLTDAEREALTFFVVLSHSKDGRIARHANTLGAMLQRLA